MMNKTKLFGLSVLVLLTLVAVTSFASAAVLTASLFSEPSEVASDATSFPIVFDLSYTGSSSLTIDDISLALSQGTFSSVTFNPGAPFSIGDDDPLTTDTRRVTATVNIPTGQTGSIAGVITADPSGSAANATVSFSVPIASAGTSSFTVTKMQGDLTQTQDGIFKVKNTGTTNLEDIVLTQTGDFGVELNPSGPFDLAAGEEESITVSFSGSSNLGFGSNTVTIDVQPDGLTKKSVQFTIVNSFCEAGSVGGDLEITNVKVSNTGEGKDDNWKLLDTIEVEIDFENSGNDDLEDIFIEVGFFDSSGKNQISNFEFEEADEEEFDYGDLDEGDDDTVTFKFKVPVDFEDGKYKLTIKVYSDKSGEDVQCTDTASDFDEDDRYMLIDVERESDKGRFIAFDEIEFTPVEATCGDRVTMTLDVFNVGDEDQDQVKITLKNTELGIDEFVEIRTNLDQGDKETISFDFVMPSDAEDKFYPLALSAEYDYNRGTYRAELDEDVLVQLRVIGCGTGTGSSDKIAIIIASLDSDGAVAGGEIIIKATITNLKPQRTAFAVDALGYQSWATLDDISPRIVDLAEGESKDVFLTFVVDEDVEGERSFDIEVKDGLGGSETREIALNIEGSSASGVGFDFGDNAFLWVIGAVNVILVILIIVVAVRVARR